MPCYSAWNDYLEPNTPQYERARAVVFAKLLAVQHIVDYYYRSHGHQLPQLGGEVIIDPHRQPRSRQEAALREMICHHFSCDGIDFCTIYDVASLLDTTVEPDKSYLAVLLPCASLMRKNKERFVPAKQVEQRSSSDA